MRIHLLCLAAALALTQLAFGPGQAQPAAKIPRVGIILFGGPGPVLDAFRAGLEHLGYIDGRTVVIEPKFAEGQLDRMPALAAELVRQDVDVIAAIGAVAARAAQHASSRIPVVFVAALDPVAAGMAATMDHPGGNLTGITNFDPQQPEAQFELLKRIFPALGRIAILSDQDIPRPPTDPEWNPLERANDTAARAAGLQPQWLRLKGPAPDIDVRRWKVRARGRFSCSMCPSPSCIGSVSVNWPSRIGSPRCFQADTPVSEG
jgi:putative ABC transport system substrate-binding protein